jgi:hypothetical protein
MSKQELENQLTQKISRGQAARLLNLTRARISQAEHEGIITADTDGKFILEKLVHDWLHYVDSRKDESRIADEKRIRQLKIEALEREEGIANKTLVPRRATLDWVYDREARLAAAYHGLPGRFTRDVKERQRLLKMISDVEKKFHREIKDDDAA